MSPPTAQSRPRQGGLEVISGGSGFDVSSVRRLAPPWQVYAIAYRVAGRSGERLALIAAMCPRCGRTHVHTARVSFTSGIRTAPCGARYVVHVDTSIAGGAA